MAICLLASTCLLYLICISSDVPRKQAEVKVRIEAAFGGTPLRAEYLPGDKRSKSSVVFSAAATAAAAPVMMER